MSRYRIYIVFALVIAIGLAGVFLVSLGFYPVAMVNGDFLSARRFAKEYRAASLYYENLRKTYEQILKNEKELKSNDVQLAVINGLIEKSLIAAGARDEAGGEFNYLIENKLRNVVVDGELEKAVLGLYGMNKNEFTRDVLLPQAEREILAGRLFLRGEKLDDWLVVAKEAASVIIFSPNFKWDGKGVIKN